jgi:hypothetical protein
MNYEQMKEDRTYDEFMTLYQKRIYGHYMTAEETARYNELLDRYLL